MALRRSSGHLPDADTAAAQFEARIAQRMAAMDLVSANARSEPFDRHELAALIDRYGMSVLFAEVVRISGLMVEALTNQSGVPPELVLDAVRKKVRLDLTTGIIENKQRSGTVPRPSSRVGTPASGPVGPGEPAGSGPADPVPGSPGPGGTSGRVGAHGPAAGSPVPPASGDPYDVAAADHTEHVFTDGHRGGHGPTGRYGPDGRSDSGPRLTVLDGGADGSGQPGGRRKRR